MAASIAWALCKWCKVSRQTVLVGRMEGLGTEGNYGENAEASR
jgi:hypothetical protein